MAAGSDSLVMTAAIMTEAMVTGAAAAAAALFRMRRQLGCHCGSSGLPAAQAPCCPLSERVGIWLCL